MIEYDACFYFQLIVIQNTFKSFYEKENLLVTVKEYLQGRYTAL